MSDVKYKPNYGYADGSPFHMVLIATKPDFAEVGEDRPVFTPHEVFGPYGSLEEATGMACAQAVAHHGKDVFVLSPTRVIRTSSELVGEHFEPSRTPRDRAKAVEPPTEVPEAEDQTL